VREVALIVRDALAELKMPAYAKTSGAKGIHVYVPIASGPGQHEVWAIAKSIARDLEGRHPRMITAESRIASRPPSRVLIDYNQNASGRTLASVYSVRPTSRATVSTPVTWGEIESGVVPFDFRIDNVPSRLIQRGDLWAPLTPDAEERFDLRRFL
jgi:bifunctional non-homologous end joining protein LigD